MDIIDDIKNNKEDDIGISSNENRKMLQELQRLAKSYKFEIKACGYFIVNRHLVGTV
jgi:hypothetical protein